MPGIYVNLAQKDGVTPLFLAVQQGNLEVVKLLLAARGHQRQSAKVKQWNNTAYCGCSKRL